MKNTLRAVVLVLLSLSTGGCGASSSSRSSEATSSAMAVTPVWPGLSQLSSKQKGQIVQGFNESGAKLGFFEPVIENNDQTIGFFFLDGDKQFTVTLANTAVEPQVGESVVGYGVKWQIDKSGFYSYVFSNGLAETAVVLTHNGAVLTVAEDDVSPDLVSPAQLHQIADMSLQEVYAVARPVQVAGAQK